MIVQNRHPCILTDTETRYERIWIDFDLNFRDK